MALTLTQNFASNLDLNQLKTVIQYDSFQKQRLKDLKVVSYELSNQYPIIIMKKILELEIGRAHV
mgnify:CR=1 FL=1